MSNTAMCESEYDAAMCDEPHGAMASAITPRPRRRLLAEAPDSSSPRNQFLPPASSGGSSSAISHSGDPRDSCRTSHSLISPSAAPAETNT